MKVKSLSCVLLLATPWTSAYQAPPSMGFSRQEYWSGVPLPSWVSLLQSLLKYRLLHSLRLSDSIQLDGASVQFSSVQSLSRVLTLCNPMNRSIPGLPVHHQLPEFTKPMSIESVMPSSHLILCCPLLLLPPIPPSIRVFSNESTLCMRWPKYWSFSLSISPSNGHPGLISFRMDWLDLHAEICVSSKSHLVK